MKVKFWDDVVYLDISKLGAVPDNAEVLVPIGKLRALRHVEKAMERLASPDLFPHPDVWKPDAELEARIEFARTTLSMDGVKTPNLDNERVVELVAQARAYVHEYRLRADDCGRGREIIAGLLQLLSSTPQSESDKSRDELNPSNQGGEGKGAESAGCMENGRPCAAWKDAHEQFAEDVIAFNNQRRALEREVQRLTERLSASPLASEGAWVLVPREPTEAMINAYCDELHRLGFTAWVNASTIWPVLLSASPSPPGAVDREMHETLERYRVALETIRDLPDQPMPHPEVRYNYAVVMPDIARRALLTTPEK